MLIKLILTDCFMTNLYLSRGWRYIESDPVREVKEGYRKSDYHIVIASSNDEASKKLIEYLKQNTRCNWSSTELKELTAKKDIPLEDRVEILREIFPIIE